MQANPQRQSIEVVRKRGFYVGAVPTISLAVEKNALRWELGQPLTKYRFFFLRI